jgi:hypothetical protein
MGGRLLLGILSLAGALRLLYSGVWPEVVPDEGLWTTGAKNFLLFGDWFLDDRTHVFLSPVFHALCLLAFSILEPGIGAARLVSGLAGTLSVWLLHGIVLRLGGRRDLALAAAALLAVNEFAVNLSRQAMIEPLELVLALGAARLLLDGGRPGLAGSGGLLALGLLTKINLLPFTLALAIYAALSARQEGRSIAAGLGRGATLLAIGIGVAGLGYALLWASSPERFVSAFRFALGDQVAERGAMPIARLGRAGLDPELVARTLLGIFRESPFLMVLATLGASLALVARPRGSELFAPWLVIGAGAQLVQLYQPTRYFYLLLPPLCFFAAHALCSLAVQVAPGTRPRLRAPAVALAVYVAFELCFIVFNAVANPAVKIATLRSWAADHLGADDRVLAASYLCTDLRQRAYGHYYLARSPAELLESIEAHRIDWVIQDDQEWKPELRAALEERFPEAARFPFGRVFRVPREG